MLATLTIHVSTGSDEFWHRETRLIGATASTAGYAMGRAQEIRSIYNEKIQTLDKKIDGAERELAAINAR